jgi:hypothetical protein
MSEPALLERSAIVRHGRRLEYFTIAWNALEGLVAVVAGTIAGSISLVGFGIDSFIEVTSGSVLLWRMSVDADVHGRDLNEKRALRIVGVCFLLLATYVAYESTLELLGQLRETGSNATTEQRSKSHPIEHLPPVNLDGRKSGTEQRYKG